MEGPRSKFRKALQSFSRPLAGPIAASRSSYRAGDNVLGAGTPVIHVAGLTSPPVITFAFAITTRLRSLGLCANPSNPLFERDLRPGKSRSCPLNRRMQVRRGQRSKSSAPRTMGGIRKLLRRGDRAPGGHRRTNCRIRHFVRMLQSAAGKSSSISKITLSDRPII